MATKDLWGFGALHIATWLATTVILAVTTMALYVGAYHVAPQALPLSAAVWSLAIAAFLRLTWRHLAAGITDDIRSGDIALRMRYPFPYLGYIFADHAGRSIPTSVPFLALSAYALGGWPTISAPLLSGLFFLMMVAGSLVLSTCIYILLGLAAFWMEDAMPLLRIVEKLMLVLGGSIVPLALLPHAARTVLEYIPFTATGFPAQVTTPDFFMHALRLLAIEYVWVAVFVCVVAVTWRIAARRVEVNGG